MNGRNFVSVPGCFDIVERAAEPEGFGQRRAGLRVLSENSIRPRFATSGKIIASLKAMFAILHAFGMFVADLFKSRSRLEAENLFLRYQLNIALRRAPPIATIICTMGGAPATALLMLELDGAKSRMVKKFV